MTQTSGTQQAGGLELRQHEDPDERLGSEFYNERQYL